MEGRPREGEEGLRDKGEREGLVLWFTGAVVVFGGADDSGGADGGGGCADGGCGAKRLVAWVGITVVMVMTRLVVRVSCL